MDIGRHNSCDPSIQAVNFPRCSRRPIRSLSILQNFECVHMLPLFVCLKLILFRACDRLSAEFRARPWLAIDTSLFLHFAKAKPIDLCVALLLTRQIWMTPRTAILLNRASCVVAVGKFLRRSMSPGVLPISLVPSFAKVPCILSVLLFNTF